MPFETNLYSDSNLDANSLPIPGKENANDVKTDLATWNSYLAPWDSKNKQNTKQAEYDEEKGVKTTLPGKIGHREALLDYRADGAYKDDVSRFDRVVNFFTKEKVTTNLAITHTPNTIPYGETKDVKYAGKAENTALSPVLVAVNQRYRPIQLFSKENALLYQLNDPLNYQFSWEGLDSKKGTVKYALNGTSSTGSVYDNNDPGTRQNGQVTIPKLVREGKNTLTVYLEDENKFKSNVLTFDFYVFRSLPIYDSVMTVRSLPTGTPADTVVVQKGEAVETTSKFVQTNDKETIKPTITTTLPANITKIANTTKLTINGKVFTIPDTAWSGQALKVPLDAYVNQAGGANGILPGKVNNTIQITYQVTSSIEGEVTLNSITLDGSPSTSIPDKPTLAKTNTTKIITAVPELRFDKVPLILSYGTQKIPGKDTVYSLIDTSSQFTIKDTTKSTEGWHVSLAVTTPLKTNTGQLLDCQFIYKDGVKNIPINPTGTTVYSNKQANNGIVDLGWGANKSSGLDMKVKADQKFKKQDQYNGELTWTINIGP